MSDEVRAPAIDLPDDFLDGLMGPEGGEGKGLPVEEENTTADETDADDDETDGQLDDAEDGGTEDEVGEEGYEDESDDDGNEEDFEEDSETEGEDNAEDTFLSKENLAKHQKAIQKDPHLRAVYKSMQADYTRKTTEVAQVRNEVRQMQAEYEAFEQMLIDTAEGGGRESFLLDAALAEPEAFQRAFDRAAELLEDPGARKKYEREREVEQRERHLEERERQQGALRQQARVEEIHSASEAFAQKFGIKGDAALKVAKKYVAQVILQNRQAGQHTDVYITEAQIRDAVREAALDIRAGGGAVPDQNGKRKGKTATSPEQVREIARKSRPRAVPGKRSPAGAVTLVKPPKDLPRGVDALDARVDQMLSG
jgi:hypothetical protein